MFHRVKSEGQDTREENAPEQQEETLFEDAQEEEQYEEAAEEAVEEQEEEQEEATFSYRRPAASQPARPAVGGYPGSSYGSATPPAYGAAAQRRDTPAVAPAPSGQDRRLTIGAGITMSGEIESCDYLLVEGTVEAALKGANILEIAESGTFYGTVEIDEASIAGRFEGDITVHGRLTITSTGTVTGSIIYKELELEAGAVIDGKLTPLSALAAPNSAPTSNKVAPGKKKVAPKAKAAASSANNEAANNDGGLFGRATAVAE
ncbi:MAG: hypothetical protein CBB87_02405 [Micavibrio sp. TMED27]|nr:hypothetical protein [Micavibrio sp.]OUT92177.1 MAG: hypothetical protein CBB87_02405 [Micavibrio sp. TMED27]|tara:strand:+ start:1932 stop:2717 length:786 start_codon:yes stop_codon:yes gene_type:complete